MCSPLLAGHRRLDISVDQDSLLKLIEACADIESSIYELDREQILLSLRQYLVLLLCPPSPFINSKVQPVKFGTMLLDELTDKSEKEDDKSRKEKRTILSLIALS